jgi:Tol biopolymer transport system component
MLAALSANAFSQELITRSAFKSPFPAGGDSGGAIVSPDGRRVAFSSGAALLGMPSPGLVEEGVRPIQFDVYVRDLSLKQTILVSVDPLGRRGNGPSRASGFIEGGVKLLFESDASNLVAEDKNKATDIFLRDLVRGVTELVSVNRDQTGSGHSFSQAAAATPDGRFVVFESNSTNLAPVDSNKGIDIFVRDLQTKTTELISFNFENSESARAADAILEIAGNAVISDDGRFVAYRTAATNAVASDSNRADDIVLRDRLLQTNILVSANPEGLPANGHSENPLLSANGRFVAFSSYATDLTSDAVSRLYSSIYLRDVDSGVTRLVSDVSLGFGAVRHAMTRDGKWIAYQQSNQVWLWNADSGQRTLVSTNALGQPAAGHSDFPQFTTDGGTLIFCSVAGDLAGAAGENSWQAYAHDLASGINRLISQSDGQPSQQSVHFPNASHDGTVAAFQAFDSSLIPGDHNHATDVFARNTVSGTTELVSTLPAEPGDNLLSGGSALGPAALSADGRFVLYASVAPNLTSGASRTSHLFLRDLLFGTNHTITVSTDGQLANGFSYSPVLNRDGTVIAFVGMADNLAPGDTNQAPDIFTRDLRTGETKLVSINRDQTASAMGASSLPSISGDGRWVAFQSLATNLVSQLDTNNRPDVFVRDLLTGQTMLASQVQGSDQAGDQGARSPLMLDGGMVLFYAATPNNLIPGKSNVGRLYARSLLTGELRVIPFSGEIGAFAASDNGQAIVFTANPNSPRPGVVLYDGLTGKSEMVCTNCVNPVISNNGKVVAFETTGIKQIMLWERATRQTELVSHKTGATIGGTGDSIKPVIAAGGATIFFESKATNLVPNDENGFSDIFIWDRLTKQNVMLSRNLSKSNSGQGPSVNVSCSADGRTAVFQSFASDLVAADLNNSSDLFVVRFGSADSDADGLDDGWEFTYFSDLSRNGELDADADGLSDAAEFLAGTNPINDDSVLRVVTVTALSNGQTAVLWESVAGKRYQVLYKDHLQTEGWINLGEPVQARSNSSAQVDPDSAGRAHRFYRVVLLREQ